MEKKQTAVEWFYTNLKNYKSLDLNDKLIQDLYKKAIQMEQEQIVEAYYMGDRYSCCGCYDSSTEEEAADYYNEIYLGIKKEEKC